MTNRARRSILLACALAWPACRSSPLTAGTQPATCPSTHGATPVTTTSGNVDAMLSDGENLYVLDKSHATVSVAPVGGGSLTTLATFPTWWGGECGQPSFLVDCLDAAMAADDDNIYAGGPLGIYSVPKSGGTPRPIITYDGKSAFMFGTLVFAGGSLFWQEGDIVPVDEGLTLSVRMLQLTAPADASATPQPFPSSGETTSSSTILASDGSSMYWMGDGENPGGYGIRAAPIAGGAATTIYTSDTLAVENLTIAGGKVIWNNQQFTGGPISGPIEAQSPNELVQAIASDGSGAAKSLITFPKNTDPGVRVLGDAHFAYAAVFDFEAGTSAIMAAKLSGGAAKTLAKVPDLLLATVDACNVYYATTDGAIEKLGKPSP